jgi:predicted DNA-binding WGR domain protein
MKKSFEFRDGKSAKFWEIEVIGEVHRVRFGKIGTAGQTKEKSFPSAEKSSKAAEALIAEKTEKGYVPRAVGTLVSDEKRAELAGVSVEDLEVSVRTAGLLAERNVETLADLIDQAPDSFPALRNCSCY